MTFSLKKLFHITSYAMQKEAALRQVIKHPSLEPTHPPDLVLRHSQFEFKIDQTVTYKYIHYSIVILVTRVSGHPPSLPRASLFPPMLYVGSSRPFSPPLTSSIIFPSPFPASVQRSPVLPPSFLPTNFAK